MNDWRLFMNYRRLKHIKRCNHLPIIVPEDVAQHSFYTAMLAMAIGDEYNTYAEDHNLEFHPIDCENQMELLNMEKLLRKALVHDTEESFIGDIPWHVKHMTPEFHEQFTQAISQKIDKIYEGTQTMELYHKLGTECKSGFEGQFVNLVDMLELAIYSWEECSMGNQALVSLLDKCITLVKQMELSGILAKASPLYREIMKTLEFAPASLQLEDAFDIS